MLNKSITFPGEEEHGHSTISEINYSYEFIEDIQDSQGNCYYQLASFFTSKEPVEDTVAINMNTLENAVNPLSAREITSTIYSYDNPPMNTKPRKQNNNWGPKKFAKENHVIKLMV